MKENTAASLVAVKKQEVKRPVAVLKCRPKSVADEEIKSRKRIGRRRDVAQCVRDRDENVDDTQTKYSSYARVIQNKTRKKIY